MKNDSAQGGREGMAAKDDDDGCIGDSSSSSSGDIAADHDAFRFPSSSFAHHHLLLLHHHDDDDSDTEEDDDQIAMRSQSPHPHGGREGEKWKEHYSSSHRILLVGEGDFSFSLSLAKAFASSSSSSSSASNNNNIVSTSLDSRQDLVNKYSNAIRNVRQLEDLGCLVLCGVDATTMSQHFFLRTQRFDRIVYNFPHVGFLFPEASACQIKLNKRLVKGFLMNAKVLLRKEKGEIHVTHKDGDPYDRWDLVKKAEKLGLVHHESVPFNKNKYAGYDPKRAHGSRSDAPFGLGKCTTFKFRHGQTC